MKIIKHILPLSLAVILAVSPAVPALAAEPAESAPSEKAEVIYITLASDGTLKDTYVVNSFSGGEITDYGNYSSVKC